MCAGEPLVNISQRERQASVPGSLECIEGCFHKAQDLSKSLFSPMVG